MLNEKFQLVYEKETLTKLFREGTLALQLMQLANFKLAVTYWVQIENSANQNDDKRHSEDGKVQHD